MLLVFGPAVDRLRLRAGAPADAAAVRAGDRPAAIGRGRRRASRRSRRRTTSCAGATTAATSRSSSGSRDDPFGLPEAGIGDGGDDPPFAGMHDAGAAVAGGSLRAIEAILRGDVEHALHPGGGLHHAMPDRASGFCIYDDPALAIARARRDGLRVLYIDLDVHHGDGVQAIHWDDPGVLTFSIHETGRSLFPGTGDASTRSGEGDAAGTAVNVPLRPGTGEGAWLAALRDAAPRAGRRVRAGPHRVAARRRLARLGPARAPERDDDRAWARRRGSSTGWRIGTRAVAGWRPVAAATTRTGWCRGPGALTWLAGAHREVPARRRPRLAGAVGVRGGAVRTGAAARDVRRRPERRAPVDVPAQATAEAGSTAVAPRRPSGAGAAAAARGSRPWLVGPARGPRPRVG